MAAIDLDLVRATFRSEARDNLGALEVGLMSLDTAAPDPEHVNALFRTAHNLKGAAHTAGCRHLGELAHVVEELFDRWRDGRLVPTTTSVTWALNSVEALEQQLAIDLDGETGAQSSKSAGGSSGGSTSLRTSVEQLDELVGLISQIVIERSRVEARLEAPDPSVAALRDLHESSARLYTQLRDLVFELRLTPVAPLFQRLRRTVDDVARKCGKSIEFVTEGDSLQVDATMIDGLRDPLMHMVRNSVDHGIEHAEFRIERGKPAAGTVRLSAKRQGGFVVLELSDDGNGLDRAKILAKAKSLGHDLDEAGLTDTKLAELIFSAGFSTASRVDDISGRGVGMDVVRKNIEALRGTIDVRTEPGRGTTFRINVPLSMAILDGFHVEIGDSRFVIPSLDIVECLASPPASSAAVADTVEIRGDFVPRVHLGELFKIPRSPGPQAMVVIDLPDSRVALAVDRLVGERQTVLEPTGPLLRNNRAVAGTTVLGSGHVAVVLDVHRVVEDIRQSKS